MESFLSGKKKQHKHRLFGPDFPRTFLTLTPGRPWVKKFLPITGAVEKRTFWCGRPRFSARTSMTRSVFEKLCTKVCVDFLAPILQGFREFVLQWVVKGGMFFKRVLRRGFEHVLPLRPCPRSLRVVNAGTLKHQHPCWIGMPRMCQKCPLGSPVQLLSECSFVASARCKEAAERGHATNVTNATECFKLSCTV